MKKSDPHSILRAPHCMSSQLDQCLHSKISRYLSVVISQPLSKIQKKIPADLPTWGKVRIANGGDSIRTASSSWRPEKERNMSFVWVRSLHFKGVLDPVILHFLIILVWDRSPRCTETDDSHHILWKTRADPGIQNTRLAILGHLTRKDHTFGRHYTLCHKWERRHKTTHNIYWNYNADCNQFTNSRVCGRESTDTK